MQQDMTYQLRIEAAQDWMVACILVQAWVEVPAAGTAGAAKLAAEKRVAVEVAVDAEAALYLAVGDGCLELAPPSSEHQSVPPCIVRLWEER